jgi:hypothetical protein
MQSIGDRMKLRFRLSHLIAGLFLLALSFFSGRMIYYAIFNFFELKNILYIVFYFFQIVMLTIVPFVVGIYYLFTIFESKGDDDSNGP